MGMLFLLFHFHSIPSFSSFWKCFSFSLSLSRLILLLSLIVVIVVSTIYLYNWYSSIAIFIFCWQINLLNTLMLHTETECVRACVCSKVSVCLFIFFSFMRMCVWFVLFFLQKYSLEMCKKCSSDRYDRFSRDLKSCQALRPITSGQSVWVNTLEIQYYSYEVCGQPYRWAERSFLKHFCVQIVWYAHERSAVQMNRWT